MDDRERELERAVDEVLDPVWPRERRRAAAKVGAGAALRWTAGMGSLLVIALVWRLAVGVTVPWPFFAFMGVVMAVCVPSGSRDRRHLRR